MRRLSVRGLRGSIAALLRGSLALGAFAACTGYATNCQAERRIALVIGIERYENIAVVPKATEDARAVAAELTAVGFRSTVLSDAKRSAADAAFKALASQIEVDDVLVLYFVGNGVVVNSKNFLLFVDVPAARIGEEARILEAGLPLDDVVATLQKRGARVFAIIDASRPNPFDRPGIQAPELATGLVRAAGLPMTYTMFSASPGEKASTRTSPKDISPNSVFARVLLSKLGDANLSIAEFATAVQLGVRDLSSASNLKQVPLLQDNGIGSTRFSAGKVIAKFPDKLKLRAKPDGGNRYSLAEIADIEDELPAQEDCEKLGNKFGDQLRREVGNSVRFWVRMKRADIGYCQLAQNRWFVEYFDRNIQDGLVLDLRN
jgi:hypothetical protein